MATNNDAAKPTDLPEKILHYINGEFVPSVDGDEFEVLDPVTNKPYIKAASGKPEDVFRLAGSSLDVGLVRDRIQDLEFIAVYRRDKLAVDVVKNLLGEIGGLSCIVVRSHGWFTLLSCFSCDRC